MADKSKWQGKNLSYMTPQMMHALKMSQTQSQNTYKKSYNENVKGKGSSGMDSIESQRAKKMTSEQSLLKYHKEFENSKSKGYTTVTETPELSRIKGQQVYGDVQYKKEFNEQKGHNIPVVETPESIRIKNHQKYLSDIKYQEDRNNLRGKATQVTDDPNLRRAMQASKIASDIEYKKSKEKNEEMERRRQELVAQQQQKNRAKMHVSLKTSHVAPAKHAGSHQRNVAQHGPVKRWRRNPGSIFDYDPSDYETEREYEDGTVASRKAAAISKPYHTDTEADFVKTSSWNPNAVDNKLTSWTDYSTGKAYKHVKAPGSLLDYDPAMRLQHTHIHEKPKEEPKSPVHASPPQSPKQVEPEPVKTPEPVHVEVPVPIEENSVATEEPDQQQEVVEMVRKGDGHIYQAVFDYNAQDDDEITFMDGDVIINAQKIDEGWMFGTVERTGQTGMLPSNYVAVAQ